jgi:hypothetical protein
MIPRHEKLYYVLLGYAPYACAPNENITQFKLKYGRRPTVQDADLYLSADDHVERLVERLAREPAQLALVR